ncbi:MAG: hypothetical protein IJ481_02570 [Alphaproteobacteria bacterium]|nr:hypothetical protein [Alphaproteobacteria bacterium]
MFKITSLALLFALGSFATMAADYNDTTSNEEFVPEFAPPAPEEPSAEIEGIAPSDLAPIVPSIAPVTDECDS